MSPHRVGTRIRLVLAINARSIGVEGVVRFSQTASGMGVEFTVMKPADAEKLHRVVAELSGELSPKHDPPARTPSEQNREADPQELNDAVLRWFGAHDELTRPDFLRILAAVKRAEE